MDVIPFVNRNGLWYLDKPELLTVFDTNHAPLMIAERNIVEFLDELSGSIFSYLNLEFHYSPVHPYDAKLVKKGAQFQCVSIFGEPRELMIRIPTPVFRAMTTNSNPDKIFIIVKAAITD